MFVFSRIYGILFKSAKIANRCIRTFPFGHARSGELPRNTPTSRAGRKIQYVQDNFCFNKIIQLLTAPVAKTFEEIGFKWRLHHEIFANNTHHGIKV